MSEDGQPHFPLPPRSRSFSVPLRKATDPRLGESKHGVRHWRGQVERMYTKEGRPLKVSGADLFSRSGTHVARIRGDKAYGPDGRYVGTIVGDRLIYRSTNSASIGSPFAPRASVGHASANRVATAAWGDEPPIADWPEFGHLSSLARIAST